MVYPSPVDLTRTEELIFTEDASSYRAFSLDSSQRKVLAHPPKDYDNFIEYYPLAIDSLKLTPLNYDPSKLTHQNIDPTQKTFERFDLAKETPSIESPKVSPPDNDDLNETLTDIRSTKEISSFQKNERDDERLFVLSYLCVQQLSMEPKVMYPSQEYMNHGHGYSQARFAPTKNSQPYSYRYPDHAAPFHTPEGQPSMSQYYLYYHQPYPDLVSYIKAGYYPPGSPSQKYPSYSYTPYTPHLIHQVEHRYSPYSYPTQPTNQKGQTSSSYPYSPHSTNRMEQRSSSYSYPSYHQSFDYYQ